VQEAPENKSEVARVLQQITDEYTSAKLGLTGYAQVSEHEFITKRMENIGQLHTELQTLVGDDAMAMIADTLNTAGSQVVMQ
jgi:hypothetical protein